MDILNSPENNKTEDVKFSEKIKEIIYTIQQDINECNAKQLKDIIIIIDCKYTNDSTFSSYKDETKIILKNYLSKNDRIAVFLIRENYKIICPMTEKINLDTEILSINLDKNCNKEFFNESNEDYERRIDIESSSNYEDEKSIDSNAIKNDSDDKNNYSELKEINFDAISMCLNFCIKYLKMKEVEKNEKFLVYFTDLLEKIQESDQNIHAIFQRKLIDKLRKDNKINLIVVGKFGSRELDSVESLKEDIKENLMKAFGPKSELIPIENMKKIKSILSSNNIITDKKIFPNEVYK